MKSIIYKIICLLVFALIPFNVVKADSVSLLIECANKAIPGSNMECELIGNSNERYISSLSAKITVDGNVEFVSFNTNSSWDGNGNDGIVELYTDVNKKGNFPIGTVTLKINENTNITNGVLSVENVVFYDDKFDEIVASNISKNIKIASTNNNLSKLYLTTDNISPYFNKDITSYSATTNNSSVTIDAVAEDENATISGTGKKELSYGKNEFTITVTSEAGTTKKYTVIVTRLKNDNIISNENNKKNSNSKLKELTVDGYDIEFNENLYEYSIEISNDINNIDIKATPSNDNSKIVISGNDNLIIGKNEVTVNVIAEDGSQTNYKIYVIKKSNVCVMNKLDVIGYDFKFDCNKYDYELKIDNETSLNIVAIVNNENSKVNIYNNSDLKNGDIIEIEVNVDDVVYKYNIKIFKDEVTTVDLINILKIVIAIIIIILFILDFILRKKLNLKILFHKNS